VGKGEPADGSSFRKDRGKTRTDEPMKTIYHEIYEKTRPYLDTRNNEAHACGSYNLSRRLLTHYPEADPDVVLPAILLHDVGWKSVPVEKQLDAFGPTAHDRETLRIHEVEGVRIAGEILKSLRYGEKETGEILAIIDGHDSRHDALSVNDALVKDADRLWRYTAAAVDIDCVRFGRTRDVQLDDLESKMGIWFLTSAAGDIAREALGELRGKGGG
jgi:HD superfamily phosphodiesterase